MLAWVNANPAVKAQIHQLRGLSDSMSARIELSLRLSLTVFDLIVLEKHLGRPRAIEFVHAVDPWYYTGETTQAGVVVTRVVQTVLDKSRDAVKNFILYSEESKSAFLLSPILIMGRPVHIRKPRRKCGSSAPVAPPAPTAPVDLGVLPARLLIPASALQPPAPPPAAQAPPPPPPSPGKCFQAGAVVHVIPPTTPGIAPVHATGLLFATVVNYKRGGEYTVKASPSEGRGSQRRVSGEWLVPQSLDGISTMFRGDKGRGSSAGRELARVTDARQKAENKSAAAEATAAKSVARAAKKAEKQVAAAEATAVKSVARAKKKAEKQVAAAEATAAGRSQAPR